MCAIYQGAWATIVALHGNSANAGLPRFNSRHPKSRQSVFNINGTTFVSILPTLRKQIAMSTWAKRGWTLQEGELSARCLYFTTDQVYFQCRAIRCCETLQDAENPFHRWNSATNRLLSWREHQRPDGPGRWVGPEWDDLSGEWIRSSKSSIFVYHQIVQDYSTRILTYNADTLKAISGILESLRQASFRGGFFWGLPVDVLPHTLAWYHSGNSRRRHGFPTWSWTGWHGELARVSASFEKKQTPERAGNRPFIGFSKVEEGRMKKIYSGNPESVGPLRCYVETTANKLTLISNDVYQNLGRYRQANSSVSVDVLRPAFSESNFLKG
jgi:hypothetical protein